MVEGDMKIENPMALSIDCRRISPQLFVAQLSRTRPDHADGGDPAVPANDQGTDPSMMNWPFAAGRVE